MKPPAFAALAFVALLAGCNSPPAPPPATGVEFAEPFETHDPVPSGWDVKDGTWVVIDETTAKSGDHVLEQQSRPESGFPHVVATGRGTYADFEASVQLRPVEGNRSRSGGLLFRYVDSANYYVARVSGQEANVRFFEYVQGVREKYDEELERTFALGEWVNLTVRAVGQEFAILLDGVEAFRVHDGTIPVGYVGLWVKDDSVTQFDDFRVHPL